MKSVDRGRFLPLVDGAGRLAAVWRAEFEAAGVWSFDTTSSFISLQSEAGWMMVGTPGTPDGGAAMNSPGMDVDKVVEIDSAGTKVCTIGDDFDNCVGCCLEVTRSGVLEPRAEEYSMDDGEEMPADGGCSFEGGISLCSRAAFVDDALIFLRASSR
jgi:hypothetical protein